MSCTVPCRRIERLESDALFSLRTEWDDLLLRSYDNRWFYTFAWTQMWQEQFSPKHSLVLVSRDDDSRINGILPLQLQIEAGTRVLSFLGDHNVTDYMDALAHRSDAGKILSSLWHFALGTVEWDRVQLRHIPASSPLLLALEQTARTLALEVRVEDDDVCPVAILCSTWDGYLKMLTKKQRHEIRRKIRRATEGVPFEWRTAATTEDLHRDLPVFFKLHEAGSSDKAGFMTPDMRDFFTRLAHRTLSEDVLRLSVFRRDGVDVAATMSFLYRGRYMLYNSGYDPSVANHSPGIAAIAHAMQDAINEKAVAFDFLSGTENYKYQFGATNTYTCRASIERLT